MINRDDAENVVRLPCLEAEDLLGGGVYACGDTDDLVLRAAGCTAMILRALR